jgi:hypothetical protein
MTHSDGLAMCPEILGDVFRFIGNAYARLQ